MITHVTHCNVAVNKRQIAHASRYLHHMILPMTRHHANCYHAVLYDRVSTHALFCGANEGTGITSHAVLRSMSTDDHQRPLMNSGQQWRPRSVGAALHDDLWWTPVTPATALCRRGVGAGRPGRLVVVGPLSNRCRSVGSSGLRRPGLARSAALTLHGDAGHRGPQRRSEVDRQRHTHLA